MRLHVKLPQDANWLGPHVVGRGANHLRTRHHTHNRTQAYELCTRHLLKRMNSFLQHDFKNKITYRDINTPFAAPFHLDGYAELDHLGANPAAFSTVENIKSRPEYCLESHHFPLGIKIKIKLTQRDEGARLAPIDYRLLSEPGNNYWFLRDMLQELPEVDDCRDFDSFYRRTVSVTKKIQFRHLQKPQKEKTFNSKFLKYSTKNLYLKAAAMARGGRQQQMQDTFKLLKKSRGTG